MTHTPNWQDSKEAQAHFATAREQFMAREAQRKADADARWMGWLAENPRFAARLPELNDLFFPGADLGDLS